MKLKEGKGNQGNLSIDTKFFNFEDRETNEIQEELKNSS